VLLLQFSRDNAGGHRAPVLKKEREFSSELPNEVFKTDWFTIFQQSESPFHCCHNHRWLTSFKTVPTASLSSFPDGARGLDSSLTLYGVVRLLMILWWDN
jgi:hypothetical protein